MSPRWFESEATFQFLCVRAALAPLRFHPTDKAAGWAPLANRPPIAINLRNPIHRSLSCRAARSCDLDAVSSQPADHAAIE